MKICKYFLLGMLCMSITSGINAAKKELYEQKIHAFFQGVHEGKIVESLTEVSSGGLLEKKLKENAALLEDLSVKMQTLKQLYGNFTGEYELYKENKTGSRLVRTVYFAYYEGFPVRFLFDFYFVNKLWVLVNIEFDSNISAELE